MSRKRPEVTVFLSTTRKLVNVLRFHNRKTDSRPLSARVTHRGPHLPDAAWYLISRLAILVLLGILALLANAIPRLVPFSNDIYFNTSTDEVSWSVSQEYSDRLDLHSGKQTRSKTLFAKSKRNDRNERVVLKSNGFHEGPVVQVYSENDERLLEERQLGPLFGEGFASLINGRLALHCRNPLRLRHLRRKP